jgi:hypothetical protein
MAGRKLFAAIAAGLLGTALAGGDAGAVASRLDGADASAVYARGSIVPLPGGVIDGKELEGLPILLVDPQNGRLIAIVRVLAVQPEVETYTPPGKR